MLVKVRYDLPMDSVSAFVLAGGKSTRMGSDKAFVKLGGETLLQHALQVAKTVTRHVWIVGDSGKFSSAGPVIEDTFRGCGPLGGIHAALSASETELNLFLAVDLPLIPAKLLDYLVREAERNRAIVTLPEAEGKLQPLCAVYRREFAQVAKQALLGGDNKIDALFRDLEIQVLTSAELRKSGFDEAVFRNLNTPRDLAEINIGK
jgi:molybdenum cofactor guanylyltransferase